jgi:hypothetical protein
MEDIIFGGVSFAAMGFEVEDLSGFYNLPPKRGDDPVVPLREGRISVPKFYDQRILSVGLWLAEENRTDFMALVDQLKVVLAGGAKTLVKVMPDGTQRIASAEVLSRLDAKRIGVAGARMVVDFAMADPFFYAPSQVEITALADDDPKEFPITNPGTAPSRKAVIVFENGLESPKLTNTINGVWVQYLGTVGAEETVEIDCGAFTALWGELSVISSVSHDGDPAFMLLEAGENAMSFEPGMNVGGSLTVRFYPPYL